MSFSIITPSFRNSNWLRLCIASVADQAGVTVEHIVQDACSDDGTGDWLPQDNRVKAYIEKDGGMYDAINRGFRRSSGDLLAYLNCDEQYLPGALAGVQEAFASRPDTDILLAHTVAVDAEGRFICCRKSMVPLGLTAWTFVPTITSSIFIRRRVLEHFNLYFDVRWRAIGDVMWMRDAIRMRLKMSVLQRYTSTFTETGENLGLAPTWFREKELTVRMTPAWARWFRWPLLQAHRVRALLNGLYTEKAFDYSIYTLSSPEKRVNFSVAKPTGIWWDRHKHAKNL